MNILMFQEEPLQVNPKAWP